MKTNRQTYMIWAIVVLAVMNLSTLATILYQNHKSNRIGNETAVKDSRQLETDAENFSGRYFRDKLNLDDRQMEKFRDINPIFRRKAQAVTLELTDLRKKMLAEMAVVNSDTARLNALSDSIGHLHSTLKRLTYVYYIDIKEICNAKQQELLRELFNEMFINDLSMGFQGRGGPGWRGGRNR